MDSSNIAHFAFSLFIPLGWAAILLPIARNRFKGWRSLQILVLALSLLAIGGKELLDPEVSVNDIASDALGFFMGIALISHQFYRRTKRLDASGEREISGNKVSLRSTLLMIERIERRSADFYSQAELLMNNVRTSGLCHLLCRDATKRANRIRFMLSGWRISEKTEEVSRAVEHAFSSNSFFSLDLPPAATPRIVLEIALDHEKKKLSLFSKLEAGFHDEWKTLHLAKVLGQLSKQVAKLELCLQDLRKPA